MFRRDRFELKTAEQFALMRQAGLVVADALAATRIAVAPGVTTLKLDEIAEHVIRDAGATPSFLGYHGYPASICVSVNAQVVHGIPGPLKLRDGDIVSIDCGAIVDGWHGDSAISVLVGEVGEDLRALSDVTRRSLDAGIEAAKVGARLSDIGAAVESVVRADKHAYGIVTEYVGHGIGTSMHMPPNVPNVGPPGSGPVLQAGMALAIEPMITIGSSEVDVLSDDWTVVTADGSYAAHWEHTIAITDDGPITLTAPEESGT